MTEIPRTHAALASRAIVRALSAVKQSLIAEAVTGRPEAVKAAFFAEYAPEFATAEAGGVHATRDLLEHLIGDLVMTVYGTAFRASGCDRPGAVELLTDLMTTYEIAGEPSDYEGRA